MSINTEYLTETEFLTVISFGFWARCLLLLVQFISFIYDTIFSERVKPMGVLMKTSKRMAAYAVTAAALLSLGACSGMSNQGRNTAIGAGVGAVGGAVLTGGSTLGTLGGAAVGGVVGHEGSK